MKIPEETQKKIIDEYCNTYKGISKILKECAPNNEFTLEEMYDFLKEYNEKNPGKLKRTATRTSLDDVPDEEIINLKKQGLTYMQMAEYFKEKKINVHFSTIRDKYVKICKKNGIKISKKIELQDDKLFELRELGYTYEDIRLYFAEKDINASVQTISVNCKRIYQKLGKDEPGNPNIKDEDIFELRQKNLSYDTIAKVFAENNKKISSSKIMRRCKKIYSEKGITEPYVTKLNPEVEKIIVLLKNGGETYSQIKKFLNEIEISVNESTVGRRIRKLEKRAEESGKVNKTENKANIDIGKLMKAINNLKKTRDVTDEQIAEIVKSVYGLDWAELRKENDMEK